MRTAALAFVALTAVHGKAAEFTVSQRYREMTHVSMNNHGHTVGESDAAQFVSIATVNYSGNTIRTFAGRTGEESTAWGISDAGVVIGGSFNGTTYEGRSGYWLEDGMFRTINPLSTGTYATANLINSRGWIVGFADGQANRSGGLHIFRDGQTIGLGHPTPGYNLIIHDFANDGTIVGESVYPEGEHGGYIFTWYWKEGLGFHVEPGRLNPPYYAYQRANANGLLAGVFSADDSIWTEQNGVRTSTGFRGVLGGLNDMGDLLINPVGPGPGWGLLRSSRFSALADNDISSPVGTVFDLNDRGQVLGEARVNNRWVRAIFTPVPEPGTWAAFLVGGALLWGKRRVGKSGSQEGNESVNG